MAANELRKIPVSKLVYIKIHKVREPLIKISAWKQDISLFLLTSRLPPTRKH